MEPSKINFMEKFSKLPDEDYSVRIIAMMNDYEFKIVKFRGDFIWHSHADTDETFIILDGKMQMNFRDTVIEINPGEMIVIPKGVEHKPTSRQECHILLVEPRGVINTGDVNDEKTADNDVWM